MLAKFASRNSRTSTLVEWPSLSLTWFLTDDIEAQTCATAEIVRSFKLFIVVCSLNTNSDAMNYSLATAAKGTWMRAFLACLVLLAIVSQETAHAEVPASWTTPLPPFQIADNLYYVGSQDLGSYLVVTPKGNILINANLASSPAQIRASVEKLGFRWNDTRILLNSQAHSDHMGGAAEIIRETRAKNMVMDGDVDVVQTGGKA